MTYALNGLIQAADHTNFRGDIAPNSAYPSAVAATNKVAALIGVGYGNRGYGQTSTVLPVVVPNDIVSAASWSNLFNAMSTMNTHTGSGLTIPAVSSNALIQVQDGNLSRPNIASLIGTLDTNRMTAAPGQTALTLALTSTRTTVWHTLATHQWTVTFTNEDAARYFFNTGGQIYVQASRIGGTSTQINTAFSQLLSAMGTIRFGASSTTYTGSGGTPAAIGYYGLTGSYGTLFTHFGTLVGYTTISYTLRARTENVVNANGGNGSLIRFQSLFATNMSTEHTVDGTLISTASQLKASAPLVIASPTYITVLPL